MLDRLDAGLIRERRFVAEASHELRTPLALLRTELDLALAQPRTAAELEAALRSASEETERLIALANGLLDVASSETDQLSLDRAAVDLGSLASSVAERFRATLDAEERDLSFTCPEQVVVEADPLRLEQAVSNLVDNAVRHGSGQRRGECAPEGRPRSHRDRRRRAGPRPGTARPSDRAVRTRPHVMGASGSAWPSCGRSWTRTAAR